MEVRNQLLALLWSGKESALKALRQGLGRDTRSVIVSFPEAPKICKVSPEFSGQTPSLSDRCLSEAGHWKQFRVGTSDGHSFRGWWMQSGSLLRTLVASPPPNQPTFLARERSLAL